MATLLRTGTLIVSVDLPAGQQDTDRLVVALRPLVGLLTEFQISATWGVADAFGWSAARPLLGLATPQELAILGDESWSAGRDRFCRGLAVHQAAAAKIGYRPTTFALASGNIVPFADLALKRGITATRAVRDLPALTSGVVGLVVRLAGLSNRDRGAYRPTTVRFGLWDLKPSAVWPYPMNPPSTRLPVAALRRGLEDAIAIRGVYHLVLDARAVTNIGSAAIRGLRRFLAHAVRRREQTRLMIRTMQETAVRLSSPRAGGAARSILHSRAA
jgi:hypothetical protein